MSVSFTARRSPHWAAGSSSRPATRSLLRSGASESAIRKTLPWWSASIWIESTSHQWSSIRGSSNDSCWWRWPAASSRDGSAGATGERIAAANRVSSVAPPSAARMPGATGCARSSSRARPRVRSNATWWRTSTASSAFSTPCSAWRLAVPWTGSSAARLASAARTPSPALATSPGRTPCAPARDLAGSSTLSVQAGCARPSITPLVSSNSARLVTHGSAAPRTSRSASWSAATKPSFSSGEM